ncbi:hypothetical protein GW17_00026778 [Ensete ventricosum]|uniref:Uncharacterized protein n=1 Tax=Ensete ventricosum TaxID=4639 RepID=A0A444EH81_ENSVE|nr:hypothetical protein GW17_00026778 [Ensete ventricosum]RZR73792.1 hypothetical protein BHM03_00028129 [Ensete ventricosum]
MQSTLLLQVDELLSLGINVTIYNGQVRTAHNHSLVTCYLLGDPQKKPIQTFTFEILVDLICSTKGTEAWVQKLK